MPPKAATTSREEDYLADWDELFPSSPDPAKKNDKAAVKDDASKKRKTDALGLETEVDKKKQRVPRVKLDDARLLSDKGIPKLRKMAQTKLKLKGKGHEFSDCARLLSFYQEWLDDLFPKATFLDALAMVEKAGHKTTMRNARLKWIDEGKPRSTEDGEQEEEYPIHTSNDQPNPTRIAPVFEKAAQVRSRTPENDDLFGDDDLYNATPKANQTANANPDIPDEDDLDALMAEAEAERAAPTKPAQPHKSIFGDGLSKSAPTTRDDFGDDDLDALMAEAEAMNSNAPAKSKETGTTAEKDDGDDLDALIAEAEAHETTKRAQDKPPAFDDEEEAMAEMDGLW